MTWTLLSLTAAVACYALKESAAHGKLRWSGKHTTFWGNNSWMRKYNFKGDMYKDLPPDNLYYRFFRIDYRERFPLSATALVFLTDGMHLSQFGFKIFLALSFLPITGWIWAGVIWVLFGLSFTIFYRLLSR